MVLLEIPLVYFAIGVYQGKKTPEFQRGMPRRHPTREGILSQFTFSFDNASLQGIAVVSSLIVSSFGSSTQLAYRK